MGKRKGRPTKLTAVDRDLVNAVEQSNRLISELLDKLELTPEERTSADIIGMEILRQAIARFATARAEAKRHRVHLRIRVAQAALAAALQGMMTYPAEGDK